MTLTKRFGYEWSKFSKIYPEHEAHFLKWVHPLTRHDFKGKTILDAGCGNGRNSYYALKFGAKKLIAFDYDAKTVEAAKNNLSQFKNASVGYKSIYNINYKNKFDIIMCIGVIHHLKKPHAAIRRIVKAVNGGGVC